MCRNIPRCKPIAHPNGDISFAEGGIPRDACTHRRLIADPCILGLRFPFLGAVADAYLKSRFVLKRLIQKYHHWRGIRAKTVNIVARIGNRHPILGCIPVEKRSVYKDAIRRSAILLGCIGARRLVVSKRRVRSIERAARNHGNGE